MVSKQIVGETVAAKSRKSFNAIKCCRTTVTRKQVMRQFLQKPRSVYTAVVCVWTLAEITFNAMVNDFIPLLHQIVSRNRYRYSVWGLFTTRWKIVLQFFKLFTQKLPILIFLFLRLSSSHCRRRRSFDNFFIGRRPTLSVNNMVRVSQKSAD